MYDSYDIFQNRLLSREFAEPVGLGLEGEKVKVAMVRDQQMPLQGRTATRPKSKGGHATATRSHHHSSSCRSMAHRVDYLRDYDEVGAADQL